MKIRIMLNGKAFPFYAMQQRRKYTLAVKQTAGRDSLGEFAPKFAQLNDDVLFGEVWSREDKLSLRDRSLVTVVALMAQGLTDSSFKFHLMLSLINISEPTRHLRIS